MSERHPGRPRRTIIPTCRLEGCDHPANGSKGYCPTHYIYTRRGIIDSETAQWLRKPQRVGAYPEGAVCKVQGCTNPPCNQWLCSKHSQQLQAGIIDENGVQLRELKGFSRPRTRDRWIGQEGYALVQAPEGHPHARADGSILEHRLVMEKQLGRYLEDWELVHHKNGTRAQNDPDNLVLLDGRKRHGHEGHPPGSELDWRAAVQVLMQQKDLPDGLRQWLEFYRGQRQ